MKSVNNLRKVGPKTVVSRATVRIQAKNASFCKDREDSHLTVESALIPTEQPIVLIGLSHTPTTGSMLSNRINLGYRGDRCS